jgi:hypothetical protein
MYLMGDVGLVLLTHKWDEVVYPSCNEWIAPKGQTGQYDKNIIHKSDR